MTNRDRLPRVTSRRRRHRVAAAAAALVLGTALGWVARPGPTTGAPRSAAAAVALDAAYDTAMALLPEPEHVLDVRTDHGVVRAYRFSAVGPAAEAQAPLVLLPGRGSASPVWADNLPSLRAVAPVYAVDLLGEPGRSVQSAPVVDDEDQARWLRQLLDALPEPEVHLVGLSIGGWSAVNLAVHEPATSKVAGMVLVDPVLVFADLSPEAVVRSVPLTLPWLPRSARDSFASWTAGGAPVEEEPITDLLDAGATGYRMVLPAPTRLDPADLAALRLPVTVVVAGASGMHDPEEVAAQAREVLADGEVLVYAGASHAVSGEEPQRLAADVARHLRR